MSHRSPLFTAVPLILLFVAATAVDGFAQRRSVGGGGRSPSMSRGMSGARGFSGGGRSAGISRSTPSISSRGGSSRSFAPRSSPSGSFGSSSRSVAPRSGVSRSLGSSSRSFSPRSSGSLGSRSSIGGSSRSPGSGLSSGSRTRAAPYGTNSSPRLYSGSYSRSYAGTSSRKAPSSFGRSSGLSGSSRLDGSGGSRAGVSSRGLSSGGSRSSVTSRGRDGAGGASVRSDAGQRRLADYKSSDSYRSNLRDRLSGSGVGNRADAGRRGGDLGGRRAETLGANGVGRRGDLSGGSRGNGDMGSRVRAADGRADRGFDRGGRGDRGRPYHHDHRHYRNRHSDFYFFLGGAGFGFGYYGGWGYWNSCYWGWDWWGWGYPNWYCGPYWYPRYCNSFYPFFWSDVWFPRYRTVYYVDYVDEPYVVSGYLPAAAFDDDPYVEEEVVPVRAGTSSGTTEAIVPIAAEVGPYADLAAALAAGDAFLKGGDSLRAAEAYRQAWIHDARSDALGRMAWALFDGGDHPLASWALIRFVGASRKGLLDAAVLLGDLLPGDRVRRNTAALERYLIDNPNDEGSNLLLGAVYVLTGREYAGLIVLTRLEQAGFERETTALLVAEARARLD